MCACERIECVVIIIPPFLLSHVFPGVRYSIHPKKRKLDSEENGSPPAGATTTATTPSPAAACPEEDGEEAHQRRPSRSPERNSKQGSRPQSRSADGLSSLRPELRQRRMQYHAVRRRKLRSGLDMIRRRKRTSSTAAAKLAAGRSDQKVGLVLFRATLPWITGW